MNVRSEGAWFNMDGSQDQEVPTISFNVVHFNEILGHVGVFDYGVRHVRTYRGKAFVPYYNCMGSMCNGPIVYGTSKAAYKIAADASKVMGEKADKELEERM